MECPKCGGRLEQVEVVKDQKKIRAILNEMGIPLNPIKLRLVPSRDPPKAQANLIDNKNEGDFDQRPDLW
jgi:hypothetical protein